MGISAGWTAGIRPLGIIGLAIVKNIAAGITLLAGIVKITGCNSIIEYLISSRIGTNCQ